MDALRADPSLTPASLRAAVADAEAEHDWATIVPQAIRDGEKDHFFLESRPSGYQTRRRCIALADDAGMIPVSKPILPVASNNLIARASDR